MSILREHSHRVITLKDIEAARDRIKGAVFYSPCPPSIPLSEITGMEIFCKLDNLQRTGSFKERGARNALAQLSPDQKKRGVIAASAGNHAQALAYQGKLLGIPATAVMPKFAPLIKVNNCEELGANVVLHGKDFAEAKARAHEIAKEKGLAYIDGYDDPAIIAGQGTMGLEMVDQVPESSPSKRKMWPAFPLCSKVANRRKSRCTRRWPTVSPFRRSAQMDSKSHNRVSIKPSS